MSVGEHRFESASVPFSILAPFSILHFRQGGVPVSVFQPDGQGEPGAAEVDAFLSIYERLRDTWQPDVLMTYGGQWGTALEAASEAARDPRRLFVAEFWRSQRSLFGNVRFAGHPANRGSVVGAVRELGNPQGAPPSPLHHSFL